MTSQTILLIDDDADLLQVIGQRCRGIGLNVQHARNLLTATAVVERFVPDIICVDVEMPTGNGLRFCEDFAADPRTANVPIIVLTGHYDAETMKACEHMGAHFLFKSANIWASLEPLIGRLIAAAPSPRSQPTTGIRPRNLLAHSIPPWPAEADAGNQTKSMEEAQLATAPKVVVADDDDDLVQMLSQRLTAVGCSVVGVHTTLDAVNAIHRVMPNLVVLDVNMPTGSGLGVCEMMATDEKLRLVPVIVLTGCCDEKTIRRCHEMLVFYVEKGADVWRRIDPLVRELLHLEDAPTPAEAAGAAPEPARDVPPSAGSDEAETLLDAVFEMLGANDAAATDRRESQSSRPDAPAPSDVIEMPWILSIDDDFDFSDALKIRFDDYGVSVARAANGLAGYRMAFSTPARAILLDYQMPNGQGDYILDRLKSNPVTRDIPVFMITGIKDKTLERRVLAMGATGYFLKPVDFDALREQLSKYIDALATPAVNSPAK